MPQISNAARWISLTGDFTFGDQIIFHGAPTERVTANGRPAIAGAVASASEQEGPPEKILAYGLAVSNQSFRDGRVSFEVEFDQVDEKTLCECVLQFGPKGRIDFAVGIGGESTTLFDLREWKAMDDTISSSTNQSPSFRWNYLFFGGDRRQLQPKRTYAISFDVRGSALTLTVDSVEVARTMLPNSFHGGQLGISCFCAGNVYVRSFRAQSHRPTAFIVMQLSPPEYDDLYREVIQEACHEVGLSPYRADETFEPGLIVSDIQRRIAESRVTIAEITPANPNVYYEVGYADALKKPVILLANKTLKQLPFDIAPYRTIFYDNTIGGKGKLQSQLRKYLSEVLAA